MPSLCQALLGLGGHCIILALLGGLCLLLLAAPSLVINAMERHVPRQASRSRRGLVRRSRVPQAQAERVLLFQGSPGLAPDFAAGFRRGDLPPRRPTVDPASTDGARGRRMDHGDRTEAGKSCGAGAASGPAQAASSWGERGTRRTPLGGAGRQAWVRRVMERSDGPAGRPWASRSSTGEGPPESCSAAGDTRDASEGLPASGSRAAAAPTAPTAGTAAGEGAASASRDSLLPWPRTPAERSAASSWLRRAPVLPAARQAAGTSMTR